MQSSFLYLNTRKLTLPKDSERYNEINSGLYKKEGWKFIYLCFLCKLYDMSNLPIKKDKKVYIYTSLIMIIASISFYSSSHDLVQFLNQLDKKYKKQYQAEVKKNGFEGVV